MKSEYVLFAFLTIHRMLAMARHPHQKHKHWDICVKCPPGFGVIHKCTVHKDTECEACPPGHYSSHSSSHRPCYPCSRCGLGLYVAHHCTADRDTVCDSCHTYKGPHNDDYQVKCLLAPSSNHTTKGHAVLTNSQELVSKDRSKSTSRTMEPFAIAAVVLSAASVSAVVIVACLVARKKKQLEKVRSNYVYEAVATQDAVML